MGKKTDKENYIHEIYNKSTFVKVKPAFEIGKIIFSFVESCEINGERKLKNVINCYVTVAEMGLFAKKITSGRMYTNIENEKRNGQQYPAAVWKSPLGGVSEKKAAAQKLRTDGKAISRRFTLAPGAKKYAVLTATQCAGHTNEDGLIVPEIDDQNKTVIRVALENWDEVEKLGIMLEATVYAYMIYQTQKSYISSNKEAADQKEHTTAKAQESDFTGPPIVWPEDVLNS